MKAKIMIVFLLFICLFAIKRPVHATTLAHLYLVFDKTNYEMGEEVDLTINLDQFIDLNEIKIQMKLKKEYLEPIQKDEKYFFFDNASIFQSDVINDFVDDAYLRLRLIKNESIDSGYYSSYKNNVCHLRFLAKRKIDNIYDCFTLDNYSEMGISVYLFNTKDEIIPFDINYNEKMDVKWTNDKYTVEVFGEIPNFKNDIVISNRDESQYEYLIEKQVDTLLTGLKTVHVGIYDKATADYMVFSKAIEVVDTTAPTIQMIDKVSIFDYEIEQLDLLQYMQVEDNYDAYLKTSFEYYQLDLQKIDGKTSFEEYLKHHLKGYFVCVAEDTSGNIAKTDYIEISITDTLPPIINNQTKITINDSEVETFDLDAFFQIEDAYDSNPQIIFTFKDASIMDEKTLIDKLSKGYKVEFEYYGMDCSNNQTDVFNGNIEVIDTVCPIVSVTDLTIEDVNFQMSLIDSLVNVTDNFYYECILDKTFYIHDTLVSKGEFENLLLKGQIGSITYQAIDYYQNKSEVVTQKIQLIDTTQPVVKINNIEPNKKYVKLEMLDYVVSDNFDGCTYQIFLDENEFKQENLKNLAVGVHSIKIIATDLNHNETRVEVSFEIIADNVIGCLGDIDCYVDNYLEVFIIVITLIVFVIIIIVVKFIFYRRNKKNITSKSNHNI